MLRALKLSFDRVGEDPTRVDIRVDFGGKAEKTFYFKSSGEPLKRSGDVLLCLGLVPTLELGCPLVVDSPVDAELLEKAAAIQDLHRQWFSDFKPVSIDAPITRSAYPEARKRALFFSGGVDSCYSLATARERIDILVTVIGADVDVDDRDSAARLVANTYRVGEAFGLETVIIETNIRKVFDRFIGWVEYHGAVLGAIRHLLADRIEHQIIAASSDQASWLRPFGSHPGLDPLFGNSGASVEHHGMVHRFAKAERIIDEPDLMRGLHVCYKQNWGNCCTCLKCGFMMHSIDTLDAFDRAPTFDKTKLDRCELKLTGPGSRSDLVNLQATAAERGKAALVARIDEVVTAFDRKTAFEKWLPVPEFNRRFRRWKRQRRFWDGRA